MTDFKDAPGPGPDYWQGGVMVDRALADLSAGALAEAEFRLLADNLPTLCWLANGDGYIVWYNRRWHDYCGTTPEQMEGWGWRSVHDPALLPEVEARWRDAVAQGEPFEMTFPLRGADGVFRPFLTRIVPARDATGRVARWFGVNNEVSDLVAAEQAARSAEGRLRRVLDGMAEGFALLDRDFRIIDMNAEGLRLEERPREQIIGRSHWELYPGTEQGELGRLYKQAMTERVPVAREHCYEWEDGRVNWLEMRAYPVEDGLAIFYRDVTDRHVASERQRAMSRQLDAILANTRMAVFLMDERQHCIFANAAAEQLTGYAFSEMQGRPLHDVVHHKKPDGSHYPLKECPIDRAFPERAQMEGEELFVARDGSFYPVAFTASPVMDDEGRPIGTVIEARGIAEEKAAAEALREAYAQADALASERAAILGQLTEGVIVADAAGRITFVNACAERLHGVAKLDVAPDEYTETYHLLTEDGQPHPPHELPLARAALGGETVDEARWRIRRPDGSEVLAIGNARPVVSPTGDRIGAVLTLRDDTARHTAERALRELNETLESRVAEAVAERERVEEALRQSQKIEAVGQLTGGIAHDLNNLLTVVTGNIDMTRRALEAAGVSDPRARRALESAMKGAERAAALTQRLLAFSRRQPLAPKPIDADRLVAGMSDLLNRALGETVQLEIVTSPGLWRVEADPNQLESAVLNLAVNARDAMPQGGTLTIETANARLDDEYAANHAEVAPGQYVVIAVTDTGQGMSRDTLGRVFEPFFTTKEVGKGTGFGLSQVYGFTKQSGGHVKIYSEEGQGTTVKIYLPRLVSEEEAETSGNVTGGLEVSRRRETILAVEDDDDVRAYTVECLRELGYRVLEAHDGPSAIRLMERQEEPVDLLFTDVVMPGMSGRELTDELRKRQPDLRVLYTSGYTRNAIVHGGRLDEGVEMIAKPFTYQALAAKVRDMLEAGRTRRVLIVEDEATVRAFMTEALSGVGYAADEAATAAEALMRVRAAQGRYDAVVLDMGLPDKSGEALAAELRALHADMPLLIASGERAAELSERFAGDQCAGVLPKPYTGARLAQALRDLGVRCGSTTKAAS